MRKVLVNKIRCKKCGDIIESKSVHDFKFCKCEAVAVDGGHDYLRRVGAVEDWEDLSVCETIEDNDTIIVLYVGKKGTNEKTQFFIKPEKLQLSNDHKDLDPATILTKIEVTLKDRKIKQQYDENN